jgi:hypothetical protein
MKEVVALAGTGQLGTGFLEESLMKAMKYQPDFIGCDAGTTDGGPFYLGSGASMASRAAIKRDVRLMLRAAIGAGIPLILGSAGTGGAAVHLAGAESLVREIAREEGLHFRLATIQAELTKDAVGAALSEGRIRPLPGASPGPLTQGGIQKMERIVGQMGVEPLISALSGGAQVVLAGRMSDAAIFAAIPIMRGCSEAAAWHAGKILECGAASVEQRLYPDCMMASIDRDSFSVWPPNSDLQCTPVSVASHTLYENANPYRLIEPSGVLDTSECGYDVAGPGRVKVSNSRFIRKDAYDVRIEGVQLKGYRTIVPGGMRDPVILMQLDKYLDSSREVIERKVGHSLGLKAGKDFTMTFRVYGQDGCLGPAEPVVGDPGHEVGLVIDVVADTQDRARSISVVAWHTALHNPIPQWAGLLSNIAFPYSPPEIDAGPVYEFALNHVMELDDPLRYFPVEMSDV